MSLDLLHIHHIAIICSDYKKSKKFYTEILGLKIIQETYREERQSYKLDLALQGNYLIELFSFPQHKPRSTQPEALGLRHIAFAVANIEQEIEKLKAAQIYVEEIRMDELTKKRFTFFQDPDHLPIEIYELQ